MSQRIPIYIPTYINSEQYTPTRVLPRLFFYNGLIDCETYWIESGSAAFGGVTFQQNAFPYFDNYNVVTGSFPTTDSDSLLFTNENASYGEIPIGSLYTNYWNTYISLLYNPKTRLINCSAIIPLADYFTMELNDIVNFRGNYYHLRAINDYSLKTGECNLQLLGPIIEDTFTAGIINTPTTTAGPTTTTTSTTTTLGPTTTTTTFSPDPCNCVEVNITSAGGEVATFNCYGQNENYVYMTAGVRYLCAAVIGGLLQADIVSGTGTITPVGNCKTGTCPPATTTSTTTTLAPTTTTTSTTSTTTTSTTTTSTTTAAPITTTTTIASTTTTTTLAPGCFTYQVINPSGGPIFNFDYVLCGENFSRSIELPPTSTSSLCIQDDKYERGTGAIVTRTETMCTTTTISPIACNTWVLDPGSSDVWYGNYTDCFGTPVSGAFVDSQPDFICALGTPQRISGGYLVTSGSCSPTTTTTSTTTLAPGCFIYDVQNNGVGTGFVNYVGCGDGSTYQQFSLAGGASGSICVDNDQINNGGNLQMVWTRTTASCSATTTTTTSTTTTTTTTLPPFSNPFTADAWFDSSGFSYEVQYTGSNSSLTSSIIS
jgi:hypothetical protein